MTGDDDRIQTLTRLEIVEQIQDAAQRVQSASVRRSLLRAGCDLTETALLEASPKGRPSLRSVAIGR